MRFRPFLAFLLASACSSLPPPPPPATPDPAVEPSAPSAVDAAHAQLDEAGAALAAGDRDRALQLADEACASLAAESEPVFDLRREGAWIHAGLVALRAQERALAYERWQRARDDCERAPDEFAADRGAVWLDLALAVQEAGDFALGRTCAERGLADLESALPPDAIEIQRARLRAGVLAARTGDRRRARELEERALEVLERTCPEEDEDRLRANSDLAVTLHSLGELDEASRRVLSVLAVRERGHGDENDLRSARQRAIAVLMSTGEHRVALEIAERYVADMRARCEESDPRLLDALNHQGLVLVRMGAHEEASRILGDAYAVAAQTLPAENLLRLSMTFEYAEALRSRGRVDEAHERLEEVLAVRERTLREDDRVLLVTRANTAALRIVMGDLDGGRELLQRAVTRGEEHFSQDHPDLQIARHNLSALLVRLGDIAGARALLEKELEVRNRILAPGHPQLMMAQQSYAVLLHQARENALARDVLETLLERPELHLPGQEPLLAATCKTLADVLFALDDTAGSLAAAERALETAAGVLPDDHVDVLRMRMMAAGALEAQGDPQAARATLEHILALADVSKGLEAGGIVQAALSNLLLVLRELDEREELQRRTAQLVGSLRATLDTMRADSPRAIAERGRQLSPFVGNVIQSVEPGTALEVSAFETLETLRGLASGADLRIGPLPPELQELAARARALRAQVQTTAGGKGSGDARAADFERIVRERDDLEVELRGQLVERGLVPPPLDAAALAQSLADDEAAVAIRRYARARSERNTSGVAVADDVFVAFVVAPDRPLRRIELGPAQAVEQAIERWRTNVGQPLDVGARGLAGGTTAGSADSQAAREAGLELQRTILLPIRNAVPDARRLHVCVDDVLHLVPLDALPDEDGWTGETIAIQPVSSLARLALRRPAPDSPPTLLVLGGADYDAAGDVADGSPSRGASSAWPPLAGALAEAEAVAEEFRDAFGQQAVLLTGAEANRVQLVARLEQSRWVHLATHGWFAPQEDDSVTGLAPMTLCGLALAGANAAPDQDGRKPGILSAEELAGFDLSGCELAVLSACETSLGLVRAGQGIQSLRAALHAAGVRTAITSLWKVDDEATRALFEEFYARIWRRGESKASALWNAKMTLRERGLPPSAWAGWVLSGAYD